MSKSLVSILDRLRDVEDELCSCAESAPGGLHDEIFGASSGIHGRLVMSHCTECAKPRFISFHVARPNVKGLL